jgi:hypothetical protein
LIFGWYWGRRARAELSDEGRASPGMVWFMGAWAKRAYFNDRGWAYQRRAIWGGMAIWILTLVVTFVFWSG